ncbi:hypothetical protein HMPREF1982_00887 [Clostridiales bacterium oral taxon 876 str. F0540]|nr:hypothetical protein HMPREF1982_00887 [Clostridiales bacterium oral taxon 876 str. F0540]
MIFAAASVIALITIIVIIACFKATGFFIELNKINIKDKDEK